MSAFDEIVGQGGPLDLLQRMIDRDRVPHALLFQGPAGVGKATVARILASVLLCTGSGGERPCGRCAGCRAEHARSHPDLMTVERLPKPTAKKGSGELRRFILVDQIRELSALAVLTPRLAQRRVFIVDPADAMIHAAQNALLKTLEEPPGRSVIVLVASRPRVLLPTVRSRSFAVRFSRLATAELARLLEKRGIEAAEAPVRAALAEGRPGRALELDLTRVQERREEILTALETLTASDHGLARLPELGAALAGKNEETLLEGLDLVQSLLRDAARSAVLSEDAAPVHLDLAPRVGAIGQRLGAGRAASLVHQTDRLRDELRFNLNRTLVAESLLAAIAGGPLPCPPSR